MNSSSWPAELCNAKKLKNCWNNFVSCKILKDIGCKSWFMIKAVKK